MRTRAPASGLPPPVTTPRTNGSKLPAGGGRSGSLPGGEHGGSQAELVGELVPSFGRGPGGRGPGGWWFATEVEVRLGEQVCRPDIVGWRRDKVPERPRGTLVSIVPDWTCEILSNS